MFSRKRLLPKELLMPIKTSPIGGSDFGSLLFNFSYSQSTRSITNRCLKFINNNPHHHYHHQTQIPTRRNYRRKTTADILWKQRNNILNSIKPPEQTDTRSTGAFCKQLEVGSIQFSNELLPLQPEQLVPIVTYNKYYNVRNIYNPKVICDTKPILDHLLLQKTVSRPIMFTQLITRLMSTLQMKNCHSTGDSRSSGQAITSAPITISNPKGCKQIRINACAKLYSELAITKPSLFGKAPKDRGIDFDLHYYDSWELLDSTTRNEAPIVCLLHGAPGSYGDFDQLISHLTGKGVRVLAPSFPTYSATFEHSFRHSPRERLDYLLEFFKALGVNQIDMLIGHSSAVYTVFELLNQNLNSSTTGRNNLWALKIKSLGLLSTPTYNLPPNLAVTPFRLFTLKLFDYPLFRPIILALIHTFVKFQGIQNKVDPAKIENLLIAASAVGYSDCDKMVDRLKLIRKFKIPTFLLIGCNDRLIPMRCFEQLKRDLGIEGNQQVKHYDRDGQLEKDAIEPNELVHVSQFESGGHYVFQKYYQQVDEDIYNFLSKKVIVKQVVESTRL